MNRVVSFTCSYQYTLACKESEPVSAFASDDNYWSARAGKSKLAQLEQLFAILLNDYSNVFEVVSIYTRLRNNQYKSIEAFVTKGTFGAQILYFLRLLIEKPTTLTANQLQSALTLCDDIEKILAKENKHTVLAMR